MTNYTVRVELHDADADDYEKLHEEMRKEGFYKLIKIGDVTYELPTAEYSIISSEMNNNSVLQKAENAANKVQPQPQPSIIVTSSEVPRTFSGLKIVE